MLPEVPECLPRGPWGGTLAMLEPRGALEGSRVRIWSSIGTLREPFLGGFRSLREFWVSKIVNLNLIYFPKGVLNAKLCKVLMVLLS